MTTPEHDYRLQKITRAGVRATSIKWDGTPECKTAIDEFIVGVLDRDGQQILVDYSPDTSTLHFHAEAGQWSEVAYETDRVVLVGVGTVTTAFLVLPDAQFFMLFDDYIAPEVS
jgi:hypothetical protein